jgi:excisionase family DNA binding protein
VNAPLGMWTTRQVADRLAVSLDTVRRMARAGVGPQPLKVGRSAVRYDPADVERWATARAAEPQMGTLGTPRAALHGRVRGQESASHGDGPTDPVRALAERIAPLVHAHLDELPALARLALPPRLRHDLPGEIAALAWPVLDALVAEHVARGLDERLGVGGAR